MVIRSGAFCICRACKFHVLIVLILSTLLFALCLLITFDADEDKSTLHNVMRGRFNKLSQEKLGVIVPFRDRFEELLEFAPYMQTFLNNQNIRHKIYVINQVDQYRFNRASLINAGFLYATSKNESCDYIVMHDVDLLPLNNQLIYSFPNLGPIHLAAPHLHPRYHYKTFVGGILIVSRDQFLKVNGMSNKYWGWGLEDDEFYVRLKEVDLKIQRPGNLSTGVNNTFRHIHTARRKRDMMKCFNQYEKTRRRDRETGLNTLQHSITAVNNLQINNLASVLVLNVELTCDLKLTPWCLCSDKKPSAQNNKTNKKEVEKLKIVKSQLNSSVR